MSSIFCKVLGHRLYESLKFLGDPGYTVPVLRCRKRGCDYIESLVEVKPKHTIERKG